MVFDLTIGTERAQALQDSIQDELQKRGYSQDADPVMAEYITIMLINNKTAEQITAELEDLIGASEYDSSFTEWLFSEAARKSESAPTENPAPTATPNKADAPPTTSSTSISRRPSHAPKNGSNSSPLFNQALNQALPSGSQVGQKRTASARSPSPSNQPHNKSRRTELPTGPRAMHNREGAPRSLLDRVGGRQQGPKFGHDEIQARIDAVTHQGPQNPMNMGAMSPMSNMPMPGNAMAQMNNGMMNQMALQEMMLSQMALMAQMANSMGILNPQGQFMGPNGVPANGNSPQPNNQSSPGQSPQLQQRRGGAPASRGGRGRGGSAQWVAPHITESSSASGDKTQSASTPAATVTPAPAPIAAPTPVVANNSTSAEVGPGLTPPARPQSPSLCKFGLKCTNPMCRYSHPSPVATPESGVVLSNDHCEAGTGCKDKDCIKAHVSPAAVGISSVSAPKAKPKIESSTPLKAPCRYGVGCTKVASGQCPFSHPFIPKSQTFSHTGSQVPCKFGTACTRANCTFQHPPGRVLPSTFHRGLAENAPNVTVPTPETGSMNVPSPHRTVIFNRPSAAAEKKSEAEKKEGEGTIVEAAA